MKLCIITIVLDGMNFLPAQFYTFNRLSIPWHWHIVHGAAANVADTGWCQAQPARVSADGTARFLWELRNHPNVSQYEKALWNGKTEMVNAPLRRIKFTENQVLMQVDMDEMWETRQLESIVRLFETTGADMARFFCRYFVGPNIITLGENCYGNNKGEWLRAWRYTPGMLFDRHEPPILAGNTGLVIEREHTRLRGLAFDHYAYAFASQVAFKEQFYGYTNAGLCWRRLQENQTWPCRLREFLPWVDERAMAGKL